MTFVPTEDGSWVSEEFERLARIIEDYDPSFELRHIPPQYRTEPEDYAKPYAIVDTSAVPEYVVFHAGPLDSPVDILTRLFHGDSKHGNVLDRLDARNAAVKALEMKAQMDDREEKMEKATWLIGTKKNFINMGNGRVVDDQLRTIRDAKR